MTCPKCQGLHLKRIRIESSTVSGKKPTGPPITWVWACQNPKCQHQWKRKLSD